MHKVKPILAVVLFLFFLEIILRAGGFTFLWIQNFQNKKKLSSDAYRIMCIGDSNTAMGGEHSFPSQLEDILNERVGPGKFKVINNGLPAANSDIIMNDLPSAIAKYQPNMVVAMMGANDRFHQVGKPPLINLGPLEHLQITKLIKGIALQIREQVASRFKQQAAKPNFKPVEPQYAQLMFFALNAKASGDCDTAEKILFNLANVPGIEPTFQLKAANEARDCFYKRGKYKELMWALGIALEENHFNVDSADIIRALAKKKLAKDELLSLVTGLAEKYPQSIPLNGLCGAIHAEFGNDNYSKYYLNRVQQLRQRGQIGPLKNNYITLHRTLKDRNIKGIYVQYPMRDVGLLKEMLSGEKDFDSMIFIDNQPSFKEALDPQKYDDYFTDRNYDDLGHCTPKGNHILASNTADAILKYLNSQ